MNRYLQHITNLCRRHKITLYTGKNYNAYVKEHSHRFSNLLPPDKYVVDIFAVVAIRIIAIPRIQTKEDYFDALHEIGHVLGDENNIEVDAAHNLKKVTKYILETERRASIFAIKANKFATPKYFHKLAQHNQTHYINQYESDWQTTLQSKAFYMNFSQTNKPL